MGIDWKQANCKSKDTSLFFEGFEKASNKERLNILELCVQCPIQSDCRQYAKENKVIGVWGNQWWTSHPRETKDVKKIRYTQNFRDARARNEYKKKQQEKECLSVR